MKSLCLPLSLAALVSVVVSQTAFHLADSIYTTCLQEGSLSCVKPKVLSFLSESLKKDRIAITEDLAIVGNGRSNDLDEFSVSENVEDDREKVLRWLMLDKVDRFLATHDLNIRLPKEILSGDLANFAPEFLRREIPEQISVPLAETKIEGRGFVKKVLIPFLLGLKFKATALIPLAIALIALKTWKALTLGLLSIVLSGAMVIFKFTKPKVVNYEVYHYPSHPPSPPQMEQQHAYGDHGYGRSDSHEQAYSAYVN